ncbi:uncharacterized protein EDB91DRAFT_1095634 [Suillus paluster]|uniref:uncharacterized protein n=1 Tax=Suillus paluster TaxID=48578 RepID=UPI001B87F37D|nr:uncharacterized protein EDB91DRAFT_1095634 [Suillus paluster]KAG1754797.1 hypothetical protein EDB91DRAFT_1095634 [Suillus paluster]
MTLFSVVRISIFSLSIIFSLIEIGLNAYFISLTEPLYFIFSALGVATCASLSLVSVVHRLIVDFIATWGFHLHDFILWVLWVATAGEATYAFNYYFPRGCIYATYDPTYNTYCMEVQAVQAFAFLNFIMLLFYTCTLLVLSIIAANNGRSVWTSSVKASAFFASSGPVQQVPLTQYSGVPIPTAGYTGTPVQQPGNYTSYSGTPAQSLYKQPQQFQPVHDDQKQGIPV